MLVAAVALGGSLVDEVGGAVPQARHSFLSAGFDTRHVEHDHCPVKKHDNNCNIELRRWQKS